MRISITALKLKQVLGVGPTLTLFTDKIANRHSDVSKMYFVNFLMSLWWSINRDNRLHFDTWAVHID